MLRSDHLRVGRRVARRVSGMAVVLVIGATTVELSPMQSRRGDPSIELDHVFVFTSADAPEARALEGVGLKLDATTNRHTGQGTSSKILWFYNAYLELLWVDEVKIAREVSLAQLGTDVVARSQWQQTGASPFGIGLHLKQGRNDTPFPTREYHAEWMPTGSVIQVATSVTRPIEPMVFVVPPAFEVRPIERLSPEGQERRKNRSAHPLGVQKLTAVRLTIPGGAVSSKTVDALVSAGVISVEVGLVPLMELTFDGGSQGKVRDLQPTLPIVIRY